MAEEAKTQPKPEPVPADPPPEAVHGDPADGQAAHAVPHDERAHVAEGGNPGALPAGKDLDHREADQRGEEPRNRQISSQTHRRANPQKAVIHPKYMVDRTR